MVDSFSNSDPGVRALAGEMVRLMEDQRFWQALNYLSGANFFLLNRRPTGAHVPIANGLQSWKADRNAAIRAWGTEEQS